MDTSKRAAMPLSAPSGTHRRHCGVVDSAGSAAAGGSHVGAGEDEAEIGRIDGRRFDADEHLVGAGDRGGNRGER